MATLDRAALGYGRSTSSPHTGSRSGKHKISKKAAAHVKKHRKPPTQQPTAGAPMPAVQPAMALPQADGMPPAAGGAGGSPPLDMTNVPGLSGAG